jgi:hypothetical protein
VTQFPQQLLLLIIEFQRIAPSNRLYAHVTEQAAEEFQWKENRAAFKNKVAKAELTALPT